MPSAMTGEVWAASYSDALLVEDSTILLERDFGGGGGAAAAAACVAGRGAGWERDGLGRATKARSVVDGLDGWTT